MKGAEHRQTQLRLFTNRDRAAVEYALERGVTTLQAEIDTDDPGAMLLLQHLPFRTSSAWITFRRERS